ncbi:hypothetical protein AAMO2058_000521800 [Amorphochlora amoebiformis]
MSAQVSVDVAVQFLAEYYDIKASFVELLPSYDDQNFLITGVQGGSNVHEKWVMKISCRGDSEGEIDLENKAMEHIETKAREIRSRLDEDLCSRNVVVRTPCPVKSKDCKFITRMDAKRLGYASNEIAKEMVGFKFLMVRLVTYIEGEVMAKSHQTQELLVDLGRKLGMMDRFFFDFKHKHAKRDIKWDLMNAEREIKKNLSFVQSLENGAYKTRLVQYFLRVYETRVKSQHTALPREQCVHNDANDYNVLVSEDEKRIVGIIDFGDLVNTKLVNNIAIAGAYAMLGKEDPIASLAAIVRGYHEQNPLMKDEIEVLYLCSCLRICHSVVSSAYEHSRDPENKYVLVSAKQGWECLQKLMKIPIESPTNKLITMITSSDRQPCCSSAPSFCSLM